MKSRLPAAVITLSLLSACNASGGAFPSSAATTFAAPRAGSLTARPSAVAFGLDRFNPPKDVSLSGSFAIGSQFVVEVADPTEVGASTPVVRGTNRATMQIRAISRGESGSGATTVTIKDAAGATAQVTASQALCGRPDALASATLIYPRKNSRSVSTNVGAMYFFVDDANVKSPPPTRLHLIVGAHGTLEGGELHKAAPPPGTPVSPPPPWPLIETSMRAVVPLLPPGIKITTQLYDDNCQAPVLAGRFTTAR